MARSWESFAQQRRKYESLHSSQDFRRKGGLFERIKRFISRILGR